MSHRDPPNVICKIMSMFTRFKPSYEADEAVDHLKKVAQQANARLLRAADNANRVAEEVNRGKFHI